MDKVHFSTGKDDWGTPQDLFDALNKEFGFTLDPCADDNNHKCAKYYTVEQDGLKVPACNNCHNMGRTTERVHDNPMAEKLSKILGQAVYEAKIDSREEFRARYGKSYL